MKNGMRQPQAAISVGGHGLVEDEADDGSGHDGDLLAAGLPGDVEALATRRGHFGQIDGDAAELDAGGEALQQAAEQDEGGGEQADGGVARARRR